jgi:hypothetical protein
MKGAQMTTGDITDDRPPAVFRHFLYLDKEEILNALSGIQGGAVEEAVDEFVRSGEGNLGVSIAVGSQGLTVGSKSAKQLKRGLKRRQTLHAAVAALLHALRYQIRKLPEVTPTAIDENMLVQFECILCHCRSRAVSDAYEAEEKAREERGWFERRFDRDVPTEKERVDRGSGLGARFVALASPVNSQSGPKFVLCLDSDHLVVPPTEFERRVTVVGQVVGKPRDDELIVLEANDRGTTALLLQAETLKPWHEPGVYGLGWSTEPDPKGLDDAQLLRPLCIFK